MSFFSKPIKVSNQVKGGYNVESQIFDRPPFQIGPAWKARHRVQVPEPEEFAAQLWSKCDGDMRCLQQYLRDVERIAADLR